MTIPALDLKLVPVLSDDTSLEYYDLELTDLGDITSADGYASQILVSIFGQRRAKSYEVGEPRYRRGWWGNTLYADGHEDGSRLWLLEQSRLTQGILRLAEQYTLESLQWMRSDLDIKDIQATATAKLQNNAPVVVLDIRLIRNTNESTSTTFTVWSSTK